MPARSCSSIRCLRRSYSSRVMTCTIQHNARSVSFGQSYPRPAQVADLAPYPGLHLLPLQGERQPRHGLSFDLGEVGQALERLEGEVPHVAELVLGAVEQLGQRQGAAEQVEVHEVPPRSAADDGAELH